MTFLSYPVLDIAPHFDSPDLTTGRDLVFGTRGFGVVTAWSIQPNAQRTTSLPFLIEGKPEIAAFASFFDSLSGRAGLFWVPAYQNAMGLCADVAAADATLTCRDTGLATRLSEHPGYRFAALLAPGVVQPFQISGVTAESGVMTVAATAAFGAVYSAANTMVSWLLLARLQTDELALTYLTDWLVTAQLDLIEIPREYPS